MKQYIDKSALVAEIERLEKLLIKGACASQISMQSYCKEEAYNEILSFINDYEVKEVQEEPVNEDLPKIIDRKTLDEYAYQCAYDMSNDWARDNATWKDVQNACKLGAKWKERQMIKDAISLKVKETFGEGDEVAWVIRPSKILDKKLNAGDKIKLIVIKED